MNSNKMRIQPISQPPTTSITAQCPSVVIACSSDALEVYMRLRTALASTRSKRTQGLLTPGFLAAKQVEALLLDSRLGSCQHKV